MSPRTYDLITTTSVIVVVLSALVFDRVGNFGLYAIGVGLIAAVVTFWTYVRFHGQSEIRNDSVPSVVATKAKDAVDNPQVAAHAEQGSAREKLRSVAEMDAVLEEVLADIEQLTNEQGGWAQSLSKEWRARFDQPQSLLGAVSRRLEGQRMLWPGLIWCVFDVQRELASVAGEDYADRKERVEILRRLLMEEGVVGVYGSGYPLRQRKHARKRPASSLTSFEMWLPASNTIQ